MIHLKVTADRSSLAHTRVFFFFEKWESMQAGAGLVEAKRIEQQGNIRKVEARGTSQYLDEEVMEARK